VDRILIHDLEVQTRLGVTDEERRQPQRVLVSVEMPMDLSAAGRADDVSATSRYDVVADRVRQAAAERPRRLAEALAHDVAETILREKLAVAVTVSVKKFTVPGAQWVMVQLTRRSGQG
jgi:FolB domain-containing protein